MTPVDSWLSALVGLSAAFRRPDKQKLMLSILQESINDSVDIWTKLGVPSRLLVTAYRIVKAGEADNSKLKGAPSLAYQNALLAISSAMRKKVTAFLTSSAISEAQVKVARASMMMWKYDADTIERREANLDANLHVVPNPKIRSLFSKKIETPQDQPLAEVRHLVKTWTGRNDHALSVDESKKFKEKDPERYKRYLALRKQANDTWKIFVRNYVRSKGGAPQSIAQVVPALEAEGIKLHPFKDLKPLKVGEDLKLYTQKNRVTKAFPPPGSKIIFNPNFKDEIGAEADWIFQFQVPNSKADGMSYAYTRASRKAAKAQTFGKISQAITVVPKRRSKWIADLNSTQPAKYVLGAMTELLYTEAMRIGGVGKTDGETTYGLSTLLISHTKYLPTSKGWILQYPGKKGIPQKHILKPTTPELERVIWVITKLVSGKKKTDRLWTINGRAVTASDVNAYFKSHGLGITPHKMRHVQGTVLMQKLLDQAKIPNGSNQLAVEKIVKNLAVQVGALLGHVSGEKTTPATAIKSYIDPTVIGKFFSDRNLRIPQWVPDLAGNVDYEE